MMHAHCSGTWSTVLPQQRGGYNTYTCCMQSPFDQGSHKAYIKGMALYRWLHPADHDGVLDPQLRHSSRLHQRTDPRCCHSRASTTNPGFPYIRLYDTLLRRIQFEKLYIDNVYTLLRRIQFEKLYIDNVFVVINHVCTSCHGWLAGRYVYMEAVLYRLSMNPKLARNKVM